MRRISTLRCVWNDSLTNQIAQPIWSDVLRPNWSEMKPEATEPMNEPPGIEAVMPPCASVVGPEQLGESSNGCPCGP